MTTSFNRAVNNIRIGIYRLQNILSDVPNATATGATTNTTSMGATLVGVPINSICIGSAVANAEGVNIQWNSPFVRDYILGGDNYQQSSANLKKSSGTGQSVITSWPGDGNRTGALSAISFL